MLVIKILEEKSGIYFQKNNLDENSGIFIQIIVLGRAGTCKYASQLSV
jgi:hypothetical protein